MIWFIYAFLTAIFRSLKDVISKKSLNNIDEYLMSWSLRFFALLFVIPLLFFIEIPSLGAQYWFALFIGGSLNIITTLFFLKSIKHSNISTTVPLGTFTPIFLLITSPLIVGEFPGFLGLIGVLMIVFGTYILNIRKRTPFKTLFKAKSTRLMLFVAFVWSITANFDKIGVQNSSPIFWVFSVNLFITLALFPVIIFRSKRKLRHIAINYKSLIPLGILTALMLIYQMSAIQITLVVYVIAIKRISVIMSVLFSHFVFKEKFTKEVLLGVLIMVGGLLFIGLS